MRFLILLLFPLACWAEPATVIRLTELKKEPASDAATVAELPESAAVDALERRGGWTRVKSARGEGWVRMLALRFGGPGEAKRGDSGVSKLFNVARTGSSGASGRRRWRCSRASSTRTWSRNCSTRESGPRGAR